MAIQTIGHNNKQHGHCSNTCQVNMLSKTLSWNNTFYKSLSAILFLGCFTFVTFRGYRCFEKYFQKPQAVQISYEYTGNNPFPSFSICVKNPYHEDVLKNCQIDVPGYKSG